MSDALVDGSSVSDPLKSLDEVFKKDRDFIGGATIEQHHKAISSICLHEQVPTEVRQLFETAKNIALYSHYAYRLHQPAELIGFVAFEKAMRFKAERCASDLMKRKNVRLIDIVRRAVTDGWFRYEELNGPRHVAAYRAGQRKVLEMIYAGYEEFDVSVPTESEIKSELILMDGIERKLEVTLKIRNFLAHGDAGLSPTSIGSLTRTAELINQLF